MLEPNQVASDHRLAYQPGPVSRMEHRLFQRVPIRLEVIIYKDGLALSASQTHDLSLNGMFVVSEKIALPVHSLIEIRFRSLLETGSGYYHVPAIVVRQTQMGVGLELRFPAARDRHALNQMVRRAE